MSCCDLDLTIDLAVVSLTFKLLSGLYISETIRCTKLKHGIDIGWTVVGVQCNTLSLLINLFYFGF